MIKKFKKWLDKKQEPKNESIPNYDVKLEYRKLTRKEFKTLMNFFSLKDVVERGFKYVDPEGNTHHLICLGYEENADNRFKFYFKRIIEIGEQ